MALAYAEALFAAICGRPLVDAAELVFSKTNFVNAVKRADEAERKATTRGMVLDFATKKAAAIEDKLHLAKTECDRAACFVDRAKRILEV